MTTRHVIAPHFMGRTIRPSVASSGHARTKASFCPGFRNLRLSLRFRWAIVAQL